MADESLSILLSFLLDQAAQKDTERGLSNLAKRAGEMDDVEFANLGQEFQRIIDEAEELADQFAAAKREAEQLNQVGSKLQRISQYLAVGGTAVVTGIALQARSYVNFIESAGIKGDETADRWIAATKRVQNASLNLGEEAARAILPVYEQAAELAEKAAAFVNKNPDLVRAALNTGLVVATLGAVGVAVSKGIKLYADFKYLAATSEFTLATVSFKNSVHEFLAGSLLKQPASGLALNSAGKPYDTSTGRYVSQAAYDKSQAAGSAAGGALAGVAKTVGTVTLLASAVIIGANLGAALGNALGKLAYGENYKKQGLKDVLLTATRLPTAPLAALYTQLEKLDGPIGEAAETMAGLISRTDQFTQKLLGFGDAEDDASDAATGLRDFQNEADLAQATDAFISYRQQEAQAEEQYGAQRAQIVSQGLAQINQIEENYQSQRANLIEQYDQSTANAIANFQFQQAQAEEQFARSEAQAEQQYQENRKETLESAREDEVRAEEDHQRELRKLQEEHNDRVRDLVASRDALGLVKEKRDFERRKRDLEEGYGVERQRRRQDLRERLQDQDDNFRRERQRRLEEFQFRQQQAAEQFEFQQEQAKAQFEERLKQLDEQHKAELALARQQTQEKLREIELQYRQEQITRRNAFYDILRDLNANLLNEENLRNQYYARMEDDLIAFLESTANSVGTAGSNLPGYQHGGYTPDGAIRTHPGEYVLNRESTKMLEGLVGGRLTQQGLRSLATDGKSVTVQLAFPGGLVTKDQMLDALDGNTRKLLKDLTRGLA